MKALFSEAVCPLVFGGTVNVLASRLMLQYAIKGEYLVLLIKRIPFHIFHINIWILYIAFSR